MEALPQDDLPQVTAKTDGRTNTGDLCSNTSWFRGFYVRRIITSFAGSKRKKNQRPNATLQMARETSEHGVGP